MNKTSVFSIFLVLIVSSCSFVESPKISDKIPVVVKDSTLELDGVSDAVFSLSGEFLAVQGPSKFYILPTANLIDTFRSLEDYPKLGGTILGFISSSKLVYAESDEIFRVDATDGRIEKLFDKTNSKPLATADRARKEFVIVSADLIITGDGNWDWGEAKGNIYLYDLVGRKVTKGAVIPAFWYASKSSDGKYVLYEHGAEDNNNVDLYDVPSNKNYAISKYFNFRKLFPSMSGTDEVPIAWLPNKHQFLALVQPNDDEGDANLQHLALFDVVGKRVVWKTNLENDFFPSSFQLLKDGRSLLCLEAGIHELSLLNGKLTKLGGFDGSKCSVSPDLSEVAFFDSNTLTVSPTAGEGKQKLFDLKSTWQFEEDYKGMGNRPPIWSPKGDALVLFGKGQLLLVKRR